MKQSKQFTIIYSNHCSPIASVTNKRRKQEWFKPWNGEAYLYFSHFYFCYGLEDGFINARFQTFFYFCINLSYFDTIGLL